jgi:hypothetical protein
MHDTAARQQSDKKNALKENTLQGCWLPGSGGQHSISILTSPCRAASLF